MKFLTDEKYYSAVEEPDFDSASRVHDWRNYIPHTLRDVWHKLERESHEVLFIIACEMADKEEWE